MRTAEERDQQTLLIVRAVVRFLAVVACSWCVLAALDLAVGLDEDLHAPLALAAVLAGGVAAVIRLRNQSR
jgi:hypothetical protein